MFSWDNPGDRVAIARMNSELQHAQLELLSAQCATDQLRLRYSADDLARFGKRDILRKAVRAAAALSEYYASIESCVPEEKAHERKASAGDAVSPETGPLAEDRVIEAIERVSSYLRVQRDRYFSGGVPLDKHQKAVMYAYFSAPLLDGIRIVALEGKARLPNPPFYEEYKALGFLNLPQLTHMHCVTFLDTVVFNERVTERALFHGLVHAVQVGVLGAGRYAELYVRGFVKSKVHFPVPLEAHAFALESRFVATPAARFSVEEQVRLWIKQERY